MKLIIKVALLGVFAFALNTNVFAQGECLAGGCTSAGTNFPTGTFTSTSSTFTTVSAVTWGGDYTLYNVTAGNTYEWSMCAADGGVCSWDSELTLYNDAALGTALCYSDDFCGDDAKISWTATFTGVARIKLNVFNCLTNSVNATLRWRCSSCAAACTNDDCATAIPLATTGAAYCGTNACGTLGGSGDYSMSCTFAGDPTQGAVWFSFVAPASGSVTITTDYAGTDFDTQINLLGDLAGVPSSCPAIMYEYGCDEDGGLGVPLTSTLVVGALVPGQTYWIQLDGYAGEVGNYCISVTENPCLASVGTFAGAVNGVPTSIATPVYLCYGVDCYSVTSNNDYVLPSPNCGVSEVMFAIYTAAPTVTDPNLDPAWTGYYWTGEDFSDCNNAASVFNTVPTLTGFTTYWLVPITADDGDNDDLFPCPGLGHDNNGDGCFDVGAPIIMHYLNAIVGTPVMNSCTGTATITFTGGLPQNDGSNYTITNTGPGTLAGTPITHGGSVTVSGLTNGQTVTLTVTDGKGCALNYTFGPVSVTTPTTSNAGPAIAICSSPGTATMAANTPTIGTGAWSYVSGPVTGTITTPSSPTTTITGLTTAGVYVYQWTISNSTCTPSTSTVTITVTAAPNATIAYGAAAFCSTSGVQNVTLTGTTGGVFSAPAGLSINAGTGQITPSTSTAGTYTVTYTIAAAGGCATYTTTTSVTITTAPNATIAYSAAAFCSTAGAQNVTLTGTTGGTYSAPAGLSINAGTGQITPSTSTPGTYTVTYTIAAAGGCGVFTTTTSVTITAAPNATIAYSAAAFCSTAGVQNVTLTGTTGGTYNAPAGLTINAATGQITPSTSTAGTYTVTYTIAAAGGCAVFTTTTSVTITTAPNATISYAGSPYCTTAGVQNVTLTGTTGGTYSAPAGLTINAATGQITPSTSTAGTYTITYTIAAAGGCGVFTTTTSVTITATPTVSVAGAPQTICTTSGTVTMAGNVASVGTGTWSYVSGPVTGTITTPSSPTTTITGLTTAGTYVYQWTIANAPCASSSSTVTITVNAPPTIANSGAPQTICATSGTITMAGNAPGIGTGSWSQISGPVIGTITTPTSPTTTITGLTTPGAYVFQWSIINPPCSPSTSNVTITVNPAPTTSVAGPPQTICSGTGTVTMAGNAVVTGTGVWTQVSGPSAGTITTPSSPTTTITGLTTAGTYVFQWTISNAPCSPSSSTVSITVNPNPVFAIGTVVNPSGCGLTDGSITLTGLSASTAYTISYNSGSTVSLGSVTTNASGNYVITGLGAGTYSTFSVTNSFGCTTIVAGPASLVDPSAPTGTAGSASTNPTTCGGTDGTITISGLTAGGTYDITYSVGASIVSLTGLTADASGNIILTGLAAGTYSGFSLAQAGCTGSASGTVTLSDPASPTFTSGSSFTNPTACGASDGTITISGLTASTTYTLSYDGPSGTVVVGSITTTGAGTYVITGLPAGAYTNFVITNATACSTTSTTIVTLSDPASPTFSAGTTSTNPTTCGGSDGTITITGLNPSTAYIISYDGPSGTVLLGSVTTTATGTYVITGLPAGSYFNFTVSLSGCSTIDAVTVINLTDPGSPTFTITGTGTNPTGCGLTDGTFDITGLTPFTTYDFSYDNGSVITVTGTTDASGNYTVTGLGAGTYTNISVTITGCTSTNSTTVTLVDPGGPVFSISGTGTNPTTCLGTDGTITLTGLTPSTVYDITYFDGTSTITLTGVTTDASGNYIITGLSAGTYSAITVILTGCSGTNPTPVTLTDPGAPSSFTISGTNPSCSSNDGIISITGLTPSTIYTITYFDGTSTITVTLTTDATGQLDITALAAGTYSTFTVSTGGCTATPVTTVTLTTPSPQTALAGADQTICGTSSVMAGNAVTAGAGTWTVIAGTGTFSNANSEVSSVTGLSTGTNTFVWTIVNGSCPVSSDTVTINTEVPPTVASVGADVVLCDSATTMTAYANIPTVGTGAWTVTSGSVTISNPLADSVNVSGITGPFTLTWTITGTGICPPTSDDLVVTIDPCVDLDVSTGFTPDGDGVNDTWVIPGLTENYPNCRVEIFTRWGAKIFTSDGYTTPWDGKYKNNSMPLGAYFFVIYFNDGATDPLKGTITIIR